MRGEDKKKTRFDEKIITNRKKGILRTFSVINPKILEEVDFDNDRIDSPLVLICLNEAKNKYEKAQHENAVKKMKEKKPSKYRRKLNKKLRYLQDKGLYKNKKK